VKERKEKIIKSLKADINNLKKEQARVEKQMEWLQGYTKQQTDPESGISHSFTEAGNFMKFMTETRAKLDQRRNELAAGIQEIQQKIDSLVEIRRSKCIYFLLSNAFASHSFSLSYVVMNASWVPSYDIRVSSETLESIQLTYQGVITNKTGDDWRNVSLFLSTAQPHVGGSPPALKTLYARYEYQAFNDRAENPMYAASNMMEASFAPPPPPAEMVTVPKQSATSTQFGIPRKATILSDHKPHKVTISVLELKGAFSYVSIPKLSPHAFLRSKSTNPTDYPFLAGKANVFVDDTFVASSQIKATNPAEELTLYLGADASVVVDFKESLKKQNKGVLAKTLSTSYTHDISVKNTKKADVEIAIFDQLPKSQESQIRVTVVRPKLEEKEKEGAAFLNSFNNVRWQKKIAPGETFEIVFEYLIEHPAEKTIEFA